MKEKLKKFYVDHKHDIIDFTAASVVGGTLIATAFVFGRRLGYKAGASDFYVLSGDIYQAVSGDRTRTAIILRFRNSPDVILQSAGASGILDVVKEAVED